MKKLLPPVLAALMASAGAACDQLAGNGGEEAKADDTGDDDDDEKSKKKKKKKKKKSEKKSDKKSDKSSDDDDAPDFSDEDPFVAKHLELLLDAADCGGSKRIEPWCLVAEGFPEGEPKLPSEGTKLGVTTFVVTRDATPATLRKHQHLSSFAIRKADDTFVLVSEVKPDNPGEQRSVDETSASVIEVLTGDAKRIDASRDLAAYLNGLAATAKYPVVEHERGIRAAGGSKADIRRVGATWLVVEVPPRDPAGIWISLFSDAPYE